MKTLRLTSPAMRGPIVRNVQRLVGAAQDGQYGPATAGAVKAWKWSYGFHTRFVNTEVTASDYAYMTGEKAKTPLMKVRASRRKKAADKALGKQGRAVKEMRKQARLKLVEKPARSNVVPYLVALGRRMNVLKTYYLMGYYWCAYDVMLAALVGGSTTARDGLIKGRFNPLYVPEIEGLARSGRFGMRIVSWDDARPGDFVTFDWGGDGVPDHIGMLISRRGNSARTIEGNTSPEWDTQGSQSNGGGVYERNRTRSEIRAVIRWS